MGEATFNLRTTRSAKNTACSFERAVFLFLAEKERFAATHVAVRKANGGADNAAQPSRKARFPERQAKLLRGGSSKDEHSAKHQVRLRTCATKEYSSNLSSSVLRINFSIF